MLFTIRINALIFFYYLLDASQLNRELRRTRFRKGKVQRYWRRPRHRLRGTYPQGVSASLNMEIMMSLRSSTKLGKFYMENFLSVRFLRVYPNPNFLTNFYHKILSISLNYKFAELSFNYKKFIYNFTL